MMSSKKILEALKASASPPFTVKYPLEPSPPPPTFRGKPKYDEDQCVGCGICVERCPSDAIDIEDLGEERQLTVHYQYCIYCANCNYKCLPLEGIKPSHEHGEVFRGKENAILSIKRPTPVVKVDEDLCIGCARCQYACSFGAAEVIKKEGKWVSTIDPIKCTGCGLCGSVCPAIVIDVPLSPLDDVIKYVKKNTKISRSNEQGILVFHCNWAQLVTEELADHFTNVNLDFINITCSGRLHPIFVLEAFKKGYGGVMIFGCPEEECHFEGGGPQHAKTQVTMLKSILDEVGVDPDRLELVLGSNVEPDRYQNALVNMIDKLEESGHSN